MLKVSAVVGGPWVWVALVSLLQNISTTWGGFVHLAATSAEYLHNMKRVLYNNCNFCRIFAQPCRTCKFCRIFPQFEKGFNNMQLLQNICTTLYKLHNLQGVCTTWERFVQRCTLHILQNICTTRGGGGCNVYSRSGHDRSHVIVNTFCTTGALSST